MAICPSAGCASSDGQRCPLTGSIRWSCQCSRWMLLLSLYPWSGFACAHGRPCPYPWLGLAHSCGQVPPMSMVRSCPCLWVATSSISRVSPWRDITRGPCPLTDSTHGLCLWSGLLMEGQCLLAFGGQSQSAVPMIGSAHSEGSLNP